MLKDLFKKNIGENYIKEFKIKNGKIKVYNYREVFFRKKYVLDYSEKNISELLEKQEAQIKDYDELTKICSNRSLGLSMTFLILALSPLLMPSNNNILKANSIAFYITYKLVQYNYLKILSDFDKKKLFLDNKDNINETLGEVGILLDNTKNIIIEEGTKLSINDINKFKYNQVKELIDSAKVYNQFKSIGYDIKEIMENDQGNQKTLK